MGHRSAHGLRFWHQTLRHWPHNAIQDINDIDNIKDNIIGDAIDDLSDIITDLLQIKWRIENNSLANGLWYFELIFYGHTQQHILDLLNFMKQKND